MKTAIGLAAICSLGLTTTVWAGNSKSSCRKTCVEACDTTTCSNRTVQWYKAKDGTYREMLPYWTAMSRAEDADDMEIRLKDTEATLAETQATLDATKAEAQTEQARLLAELDTLRKELESAKAETVAMRERAARAEDAHKQCIEQVATLKESQSKAEIAAAGLRNDLKAVTDQLTAEKARSEELQNQLVAAEEKARTAESALEAARQELDRAKQDAAVSRKPQVEGDSEGQSGDDV